MYNINYGDGMSFARYRRPAQSSYKLNQPQGNFEYNSMYKEMYPPYSGRMNRHSSQNIRKPDLNEENRNSYHQKTNSQGNIAPKNLSHNFAQEEKPSYDDNQNDYHQQEDEKQVNMLKVEPPRDPPSRSHHQRNSSYNQGYREAQKEMQNRTIDYEDKGRNSVCDLF